MADETYKVPNNPTYSTSIRKILDTDPVRASTIVNPVIEQMMENTAAVKEQAETAQATADWAIPPSGAVYSNTVATAGWYKLFEQNMSTINNRFGTFVLTKLSSGGSASNPANLNYTAIVNYTFRWSSATTSLCRMHVTSIDNTSTFVPEDLVAQVVRNADTSITCSFWVRTAAQYTGFRVDFIKPMNNLGITTTSYPTTYSYNGVAGEPALPTKDVESSKTISYIESQGVYKETSTSATVRAIEIPGIFHYDQLLNRIITINPATGVGATWPASVTLNINKLGAVEILHPATGANSNPEASTSTVYSFGIKQGTPYQVYYNGTGFVLVNMQYSTATTARYGVTRLSDGVANTSVTYAATANSAKTAYDAAVAAQTTADTVQSDLKTHKADTGLHVTTAKQTKWDTHEANKENPHGVTKAQVGLGSVNNTSDANKPVSTATQTAINGVTTKLTTHEANVSNPHKVTASQAGAIPTTQKGAASGVASLGTDGKVPAAQLPAMDYDTKGAAAAVQSDLNTHKVDTALHVTNAKQTKWDSHESNKSNPHGVTKSQVGLANADNTSDANKPVSTAQKTAIDAVSTKLATHEANVSNPHSVTKAQVGLGSVNNTSDANKPVSTATKTAIDAVEAKLTTHEANVSNPHKVTASQAGAIPTTQKGAASGVASLGTDGKVPAAQLPAMDYDAKGAAAAVQTKLDTHTGSTSNPHGVTKAQVGLGNVNNTTDANKPVSTAQKTAIDAVETKLTTHEANVSNPHKVTASQAGAIPTTQKGAASGVASLGTDGKVPTAQLPAMNYDAKGAAAAVQTKLDTHTGSTGNPHSVTKAQVGLGNVDNTSDANKPVSTAQKTAIDAVKTTADTAKSTADTAQTAATNATNIANGKASMKVYTGSLTTTWSGTGPYTQSVNINGITATMNPVVGPVLSTTNATAKNQLIAWACVDKIATNAGSITATCYNTKPTTAIPIQLLVVV